MYLSDAIAGECITIKDVRVPGATGERLMEIGLVSGTIVKVSCCNGQLLLISLRGFVLAIRASEAKQITVSIIEE